MKNLKFVFLIIILLTSLKVFAQNDSVNNYYNGIFDDRIKNAIKDFYVTKGYSKVIKVSFWAEKFNSEELNKTIREIRLVVYPVRQLSNISDDPPTFYYQTDSSIILVYTGIETFFKDYGNMMKDLIKIISPYVENDIDVISYNPYKIKYKEDKIWSTDDYPYGMEYFFNESNKNFYKKKETSSSGTLMILPPYNEKERIQR